MPSVTGARSWEPHGGAAAGPAVDPADHRHRGRLAADRPAPVTRTSRTGNGGYDVTHYDLNVRYDPTTDRLRGRAAITATAIQDLSRFNLDLAGLDVGAVTVDQARAEHRRDAGELVVTPRDRLPRGRQFTVVVDYQGVPSAVTDGALGSGGSLHTATARSPSVSPTPPPPGSRSTTTRRTRPATTSP